MSKIGKRPVPIPNGIEVQIADGEISVKGKSGELKFPLLEFVTVEKKDNALTFSATGEHKQARANWGTMAALTKNAIEGVEKGFEKKLEIEGIGFKAQLEENTLVLSLGYTHPVKFVTPPHVKITVLKNVITVSGIDKKLVGETAAQIRKIKKPEPYKGKGIRYQGEVIRRKEGKKVAGTGTT